jgi:hypothetical protein
MAGIDLGGGLKAEVSIPVALATAAIVYAVFNNATPSIADIRSAPPNNADIATSERMATITSAAIVGGISLIARDVNIFIIGGTMVVIMAFWTRHANAVNPTTGKVQVPGAIPTVPPSTQSQDPTAYGYQDQVAMV